MSSRMKFSLGLLVAANCGLLAYNAGYLGADSTAGREPERLTDQRNVQSIRLLAPPGQPSAVPAGDNNGAGSAPDPGGPVPTLALVKNPAAQAASAAVTGAVVTGAAVTSTAGMTADAGPAQCIEIGNFDVAEARRFDQQVAALGPGMRLTRRSVQEIERYIVYIPPLADKDGAERKAGELRRLGIADFYIFNDDSALRHGISLGVFKTAEAARVQLASLTQKGVRSARISPRPAAISKTAYQLRDLDAPAQAALAKIRNAFPRQENRACAPA